MSSIMFSGPKGVETYTAIVLKSGLSLYEKTGMKPNRAWTPSAMIAKARQITGAKLKARDYAGAIAALDTWIKANGTVSG